MHVDGADRVSTGASPKDSIRGDRGAYDDDPTGGGRDRVNLPRDRQLFPRMEDAGRGAVARDASTGQVKEARRAGSVLGEPLQGLQRLALKVRLGKGLERLGALLDEAAGHGPWPWILEVGLGVRLCGQDGEEEGEGEGAMPHCVCARIRALAVQGAILVHGEV